MAACAYNSGINRFSEYEGKIKYAHSDPKRVQLIEVMLPENAPREYADPEKLWNAVDASESEAVAQTARCMYIALPKELTRERNIDLIHDYCQHEFVDKGMCCNLFYHDRGDGNPHVHLMLTMRAMDENGKWLQKSKTGWLLDENGNRVKGNNGKWQRYKHFTVDWDDHKYGEIWRHDWEVVQNAHLEKAGRPERVCMMSLARQGITDRLPGKHLGPAASAMEQKGIETERGNENRRIHGINKLIASVQKTIRSIGSWIDNLKTAISQQEILENPEDYNLADVLINFMDMREKERALWGKYAQDAASVKDLKKWASALCFLKEKKLYTVGQLSKLFNQTADELNRIHSQIREKEKRIRDLNALLSAEKTLKELKPIQEEYKSIHFTKRQEKFKTDHADEFERMRKARALLSKFEMKLPLDRKSMKAEIDALEAEKESLRPSLERIQDDMDHLKELRYWTRKVIPDAMPKLDSEGRRFFDDDKETAANRKELNAMMDHVVQHAVHPPEEIRQEYPKPEKDRSAKTK